MVVLLLYIRGLQVPFYPHCLCFYAPRTLSSEGEPETFLKRIFFSKSEASSVDCYSRITLKGPHRNLKWVA